MEIDNLSIGLRVNGADDAITRIMSMAQAVERLATGVGIIDGSRLQEFANGLGQIRGAIPTANQATNMESFAAALDSFITSISGAGNITQVATDMSNLSNAVQGMGARSVRSLTNAAQAMNNFAQQAHQAAQNANVQPNPGNNTPNINQAQQLALAFHNVNQELNQTAIAANSLGGRLQRIGAIVPTNRFRSLNEQLQNVRRRYDELRERMNQALLSGQVTPDSQQFQRWERNLEALRNDYDRLIERQRALALEGNGFQLNPTLQRGLDGFKQGFNGVIGIVKGGFLGAIKSANKHISSFVKNLSGANSAQKALQKTMTSLKALPDKIVKGLTRIGKMLKLMVTRMALRAVIKEVGNGFKSLALHSDQFNESMSSVINASKQLGYSFASMISPLINAFAPAIVTVINLLTELINKINQVISALTGASTWNRAIKFTDSWADSIKEAGKSGSKAAKKLKKTVLAFDELNQLQENKNSGGSDIKDMFETVQIDPKWKEFAEWLKKMWADKDFTQLGTKLGEKLKQTLDSIPWDKIRQTSNDLGKALATLINGFVEVQGLANSIGTTVAQGVNTVFEFINGFVTNLHWDSIGKFIADTFNGFFENIDWNLIKKTVVTGLTGIADSVNSFIDNFRWDNISDTIIHGVDTVVTGVYTFFKRINWKKLGSELGGQLQKTIEGINWKDVGKALGSILQSAIDFVSNFISQLHVSDIRKALKDMVDGFFDEVDTEELGKTLADIIDLVVQVAAGFWEDNKDRLWEEGKRLVKGMFDNLDDDTKSYIEDAIFTVLKVAVIAGITKAGATILASAVVTGFKNMVLSALFGGAGGAAAGGAAEAGLLGSATVAGTSIGFAFAGAIVAAVVGFEVGKKLGAYIFPDDKEVYENFHWFKGSDSFFSTIFGEDPAILKSAWHDMWSDMWGDSRWAADETTKAFDDITKSVNDTTKGYDDAKNSAIQLNTVMGGLVQPAHGVMTVYDSVSSSIDGMKSASDEYASKIVDLNEDVEKVKSKHEHYKTTLDVIREAQEKTVQKTNDARTSFSQLRDETGKVTLVLKDNQPAYIKAGEAAQNANKKVADYIGTTKDEIKVVSENTVVLKDNQPAYVKAGDAAKEASKKLADYESSTKDLIRVIPDMTTGVKDAADEVSNFSSTTQEMSKTIGDSFSESNWTFEGVKNGLKKTFENAKEAIAGVWNSIAEKLNGKHEIASSEMEINLPKFAQGGFPADDSLFLANSTEMIGRFTNGKTAVANNAQIVEGIQSGVYNAVMSAMSQQSNSNSYISNTIMLDGEVVGRSITKAQEKSNRRFSPQTV